jgi:POT family proton-dependent oligopeptide transporter
MVGHLYPEGSALKDRAYNIFYMGINVGALLAPVVAEFMVRWYGYRPAYAVAAAGMIVSVCVLWLFKHLVEPAQPASPPGDPAGPSAPLRRNLIDDVPDWKRITALVVIYLAVIVFWMVFHQNSSTLTYWADENTDWQVSGIISNAINPFWVVTLSLPVVYFWQWLNGKGLEPATPTKMVYGMILTGLMFFFMYLAAKTGEATIPDDAVGRARYAYKVSPAWLISGYFILTLGELMLSPMGLSLVSKVAPQRLRGLMMGGWFLATAIGNKLTAIGTLWYEWPHSSFFLLLGSMALGMAVVLLLMLRPLKKAMPGV